MGLEEIRKLKGEAREPKKKRWYVIARKSERTLAKEEEEKQLQAADDQFYEDLWPILPHKCEECGVNLGDKLLRTFFHHLLEKWKYPHLRHVAENIMLLCRIHHDQVRLDIDKVPKVKARTEEAKKLLL